jgi:transketolase
MRTSFDAIGQTNLDVFGQTLLELGRASRDVIVVTSDSRGSGRLTPFAQALPNQIVEVGIAEQDLVGIAAGLASAGKVVYAVSPACFLTARSLEQIKNDVAYSDNPVNLVGISAGVSYGALGSTHHSLHDIAALRAIHNIDIVVPADNWETRQAVQAAPSHPRPVYLRFGKRPMRHLHGPEARFEIGSALTVLDPGGAVDVTFLATGELVQQAAMAATALGDEGISCRVVSVHSIKPLDRAALLASAQQTRLLITAEEHSAHGGLGEACAAILLQAGVHVPFRIAAIPDEHTVTGNQLEILGHYGLDAAGLAGTARAFLRREE